LSRNETRTLTAFRFCIILPLRTNWVLTESESWRPASPSAAQPRRNSVTFDDVVCWISDLGLLKWRIVGHLARCTAIGMKAMYQFSERRAAQGRARAKDCSCFVLCLRGALRWAFNRSKIEIAGGVKVSIARDWVLTESERWQTASPSAAQPRRKSVTFDDVVCWISDLGLLRPHLTLALYAIPADR
jgi:hypothetical protein